MEYARAEAPHRPPLARIRDYDEFLLPPDEADLRLQSARCMDCGVPFCHAGMAVAGSVIGCPLKNLIPEINDLVYHGRYRDAWQRLAATHPFPEITGRVCPALCEGSCTAGEHGSPVAIRQIEEFLADLAMETGWEDEEDEQSHAPSTGQHVAVVGGGPAGLACAHLLRRQGHAVTVLERAARPGGFLTYGIPNMKLDKALVARRVALLERQGITFQTGVEVGKDLPPNALLRGFDALVLCTGARVERTLQLPGADAQGVHTAVAYLTAATRDLLGEAPLPQSLSAHGKDVVVVGGGDTGTDCVATALRQGAASVAQLEILPALPKRRAAGNPWPLWPRVQTTGYGLEEAAAVYGRDIREYETTVQALDVQNGQLAGLTTVRVQWQNGPQPLSGTEKTRKAQLVLTAMGFTGPESALPNALGLASTAKGSIQTGAGGHHASRAGVFAAGDARRGPSLVVWAIHEGMQAARECNAWLKEKTT